MKLVLLPGMDGTGRLFAPLVEHLSPTLTPIVVDYPTDEPQTYDELLLRVEGVLRASDEPVTIVAESFSGPIGIRLAHAHPDRVRALVLVATFATNPAPLASGALALLCSAPFAQAPPTWALRRYLLGEDAPAPLVDQLRSTISTVAPRVMATRVRAVRKLDVRATLAATKQPLLCLAGSHDRLVPASALAAIQQLRPDARAVPVDAPHLVLQRRPAETAAHLSHFLQLCAAARPTAPRS